MLAILHAVDRRVPEADGEIRKLNAVLREWFERFELRHAAGDIITTTPVLHAYTVVSIVRRPQDWQRQVSPEEIEGLNGSGGWLYLKEKELEDRDQNARPRRAIVADGRIEKPSAESVQKADVPTQFDLCGEFAAHDATLPVRRGEVVDDCPRSSAWKITPGRVLPPGEGGEGPAS